LATAVQELIVQGLQIWVGEHSRLCLLRVGQSVAVQ
jgi:hypothetical protein